MLYSGRNEQQVAWLEGVAFFAVEKKTGSRQDNVNLVTPVRLLRVMTPRGVNFNLKRTVLEQGSPRLTIITG